MPEPEPENREAFAVWEYCSGQVVTAGMGEVIDISFPAVEIACRVMGVRDWRETFVKVVEIARAFIAARKQAEKNDG